MINNNIHNITYKLVNDNHNYILLNNSINLINDIINNDYKDIDYIMLNKLLILIVKYFNEKDYILLINNSLSYLNNYFNKLFNKTLLYEKIEKYIDYNNYIKILLIYSHIINMKTLELNNNLINYLNIIFYHNIVKYYNDDIFVLIILYYHISDKIIDYIDSTNNYNEQILTIIWSNIVKNICYITKYLNTKLAYKFDSDYFNNTLKQYYKKLYKTIYNLDIIITLLKYKFVNENDVDNIIKICNYLYPYNTKHKDVSIFINNFNIDIFNICIKLINDINNNISLNITSEQLINSFTELSKFISTLLNKIINDIIDKTQFITNNNINKLFNDINCIINILNKYVPEDFYKQCQEYNEYNMIELNISKIINIPNDLTITQKYIYKMNYIKNHLNN